MSKRSTTAIPCVTAIVMSLSANYSHAGPICDWLFGRNTTVVNYPVALPNPNPCAPQVQPVTVQYVPQTAYRTSWNKVPVTAYRPVTTTDPCTGCSVVTMSPCATYSWQAQRVPYTTYRPLLSAVTSLLPTQQVATTCNPCATACNPCATPCNPCATPCNSCPTTVASPIIGTTSSCSGCSSPASSYSVVPGTIQSGVAPSGINGIAPADQTPSLKPVAPSSIAPADQTPSLTPTSKPFTPSANGSADQMPSLTPSGFHGSTSRSFTPMANETRAMTVSPAPLSRDSFSPAPANNSVTPLPDLDALENNHDPVYDAPQLLDPRDKTAVSPSRKSWNYSPVKLTAASEKSDQPANQPLVIPTSKQKSKVDAGGWRTIKK